eukprot:CAMPEP_0204530698 /NCGR_PEP_ID=MMETSP0661-20131031/10766_1 /ASSEMBLY_ACC=CAM_ASM_000606 /TAXON_ID=109239 /ORGANISM="Alexandrium margalefi, Strain AMGDE01CS-322" /LENGTH=278 /DNA_ID=CAMNT_0051536805 /DNA_START=95 /DNA_END=928 /DNA_ORIENTATION=+
MTKLVHKDHVALGPHPLHDHDVVFHRDSEETLLLDGPTGSWRLHFNPQGWGFVRRTDGSASMWLSALLLVNVIMASSSQLYMTSTKDGTMWLSAAMERCTELAYLSVGSVYRLSRFRCAISGSCLFWQIRSWQDHTTTEKAKGEEANAYSAELHADEEISKVLRERALMHAGVASAKKTAKGSATVPLNAVFDLKSFILQLPMAKNCFGFHDKNNNRVRVFYTTPGGYRASRGLSMEGRSEEEVVKDLLRWAWDRHGAYSKAMCPFMRTCGCVVAEWL